MPGHHDAQIDHLIAVALQHHADNVLADIVHIALHGRHDDPALALGVRVLFCLDIGEEVRHGLFHHTRGLHHLRQEHLALAEQVADDVHAVHQRPFDHLDRAGGGETGFLGILDDMRVDALDQRMLEPLDHRPAAPFGGFLLGFFVLAAEGLGERDQLFGRVIAAVPDHVLAGFTQYGVDIVIDVELPRIDDAHVHARLDRVVQEHAVHRAAHRLVAAEAERQVGYTARDMDVRAALLDVAAGLDKVDGIAAMLVDAGGDREDIGVEDDVFGWKADAGQELVGALADLDLAFPDIGLADLVERHDDDGCTIVHADAGVLEELFLAFLHADRIDDRLARDAFQPCLDHRPFGRVDHERHARDIGLGGNELEIARHRGMRVEQAFVHVDVDDLRAAFDLLARDLDRLFIAVFHDQLLELGRSGNVGALADIDELGSGLGHFMYLLPLPFRGEGRGEGNMRRG